MTRKPMWSAEAIKAYESGQGVKLVNIPHPHYEPLPEDLNPESLETVEIEVPEPPPRQWVGLTDWEINSIAQNNHPLDGIRTFARAIEAKLKEKNNG
jgi:hypothetical protein